ncbi:hypothetical protein D9611_001694 [Ephemerocybe angulata]|uniref:SWIM-type domain-containing protein n=1 Tax=Ephemerocybe angulata TaxID=980116 RepID=A0A8H5FN33_9AGAR|nr:hypothetical protein D9611_001694 [Tulosesus angulatus]
MLVEAWHHILKTKFMQGKRNRRLDHLIHLLVKEVIAYFLHKHRSQEFGFSGPDLEVQETRRIQAISQTIPATDIEESDENDDIFHVKSQSSPGIVYRVDLDTYECECPSFSKVLLCKHIFAVQTHFSEVYDHIPCSSLDISADSTIEQSGTVQESEVPNNETQECTAPTDTPKIRTSKAEELLSHVSLRLKAGIPSDFNPESLSQLEKSLSRFIAELDAAQLAFDDSDILGSQREQIPPCQKTHWADTEAIMGTSVKTKRKLNTDPYGAGEKPGKKAKADALTMPAISEPPAPTTISWMTPPEVHIPNPTVSTIPINAAQPLMKIAPSLNTESTRSTSSQGLPLPTGTIQQFDPSKFDLRDSEALGKLKRPQLTQLCFAQRPSLSAASKNTDIIARLLAVGAAPGYRT